jgi:Berberine and berberine like
VLKQDKVCLASDLLPASLLYHASRLHVLIQHVHGAASRVSPTETAFALRDVSYVTTIIGAWDKGEANQHIEWTDAFWTALKPFATSGVYINFLGNEGEEQVQASYGANYERLVALKKKYDPANFFHFNSEHQALNASGSNSFPASFKLIFCCPNCSAFEKILFTQVFLL